MLRVVDGETSDDMACAEVTPPQKVKAVGN